MNQNKGKASVGEESIREKQEREKKARALLSGKLKRLQENVIGVNTLIESKQEKLTVVKNAALNTISVIATIESKQENEEPDDDDSERLRQLRNELKMLQESMETYSNEIVMFERRIKELNEQIDIIKTHCPEVFGSRSRTYQ